LLALIFMGLGIYLFATTRWDRLLGRRPDYTALLAEGDHIVAAIKKFKGDRGLWPEYLDDLAPDYLQAPPSRAWFYELTPQRFESGEQHLMPNLSIHAPDEPVRAHIGYEFDPAHPTWRLFGDTEERVLRADPPEPVASAPSGMLPHEGLIARELAELDRRIAREPTALDHRIGKASLLLSLDRVADVRAVLDDAQRDFPKSAWPRVAVVWLDITRSTTSSAPSALPDAIRAYETWSTAKPSMTHAYGLFVLLRAAHEDIHAADAAGAAVRQPLEIGPEDGNATDFYLWDMARWALAQQRWDVVIHICDAWEKAFQDHRMRDASYQPLRAAARLARGESAGDALADREALPTERCWAQHLRSPPAGSLAEALGRNDASFRYDPGDYPRPWNPFQLPE
jgi:hypothetical protein